MIEINLSNNIVVVGNWFFGIQNAYNAGFNVELINRGISPVEITAVGSKFSGLFGER